MATANVIALPRQSVLKAIPGGLATWIKLGEALAAKIAKAQNPLLALWTRRGEVVGIINGPGYDEEEDELFAEELAIEETIAATIATTPADLIVQVKLLVELGASSTWDESFDRLCESLQEGIARMAGAAA